MQRTNRTEEKTIENKKNFLKLYKQKLCNITATCEANNNMSRSTYHEWLKNDEDFAQECKNIEESLIDFAESQLMKNIKDGKEVSLIFFLKCKGKKRGYIEKSEIEVSGQLGVTIKDDV